MVVGFFVYDFRGIVRAAVDDAVADDGDVFFFGDGWEVVVVDELVEHVCEGIVLGGYLFVFLLDFLVFKDGFAISRVF